MRSSTESGCPTSSTRSPTSTQRPASSSGRAVITTPSHTARSRREASAARMPLERAASASRSASSRADVAPRPAARACASRAASESRGALGGGRPALERRGSGSGPAARPTRTRVPSRTSTRSTIPSVRGDQRDRERRRRGEASGHGDRPRNDRAEQDDGSDHQADALRRLPAETGDCRRAASIVAEPYSGSSP